LIIHEQENIMSNRSKLRLSRISLGLALALAAAPAFAQQTSSALQGVVMGADGRPVAGAEVIISHTPSGTISRATTDESGRYNARGLRVGGPYTVLVMREGYQSTSNENVHLQLAQTGNVSVTLEPATTQLDAIEVIGAIQSELFSPLRMGTSTSVGADQIAALPSAGRNIQDYIRLDPRISQVSKADGAISAGGQNTRYNVIRIDGVSASDPFGLESNNLPTERQPVSLDAIQEIIIDLANYDVTVAGGTGAVVNAVTRSGTNNFNGTVYYSYRDKDWVRSDLRGVPFNGFDYEETYGGTFGGPLIRDRLFFFANYEKYTRSAPGVSFASTPYGRGQITDADIARVRQIAQGYGFDIGSLDPPADSKTEIEEFAVKIDWNISDYHRAAFRYSEMEQNVLRFPGIGNSSVSMSTHWYELPKTFESYVGELFSDWTDIFSTELKVSKRDYAAVRTPSVNLPHIRVNVGNQGLLFGTEQFTHINVVDTSQLNIFAAANWYVGDHVVKFGFDHETNDILNFFGRDLNGVWTFPSIDAFEAGRPSIYQVRTPRPGGSLSDIAAEYKYKNLGVFVQDSWAVNYNLSLLFGLRIDAPKFDRTPLFNQRLLDLYGLDNRETIDKKLVQPRFGFNYSFDSERPTQLRGGVGLFQGSTPNVWLAGPFQNSGMNFNSYDLRGNAAPDFNPQVPPPVPTGTAGSAIVADIAAPGLSQPSVWKANLAFEHELPWWGVVGSAELLLTDNKNALYFDRLDVGTPTAVGQDGRMIFWNAAGLNPGNANPTTGIQAGQSGANNRANRPSDINQAIVLRNTNKGGSQQLTLSLTRPMIENWSWTLAYTHTNATEVSPITSSQNSSNWSNTMVFQANENVAYKSRYAIKDRFTGVLAYGNNFFGDKRTNVSLFYEGRSGRPFSYIFFNDVNGDGAATNDLFYVPSGPGDVIFSGGQEMEQAFFDWLARNPDLAAYAGQVVPANTGRAAWVNNFDLRFSQEVPGFMRGHKGELTLDIMNVGNLLNKKWGLIDDYGFFSTRRVANYAGIDPETGRYIYTFRTPDEPGIQENNNDKGNTAVSRWSVMLGFRYRF
jgi:hypothetical protein